MEKKQSYIFGLGLFFVDLYVIKIITRLEIRSVERGICPTV